MTTEKKAAGISNLYEFEAGSVPEMATDEFFNLVYRSEIYEQLQLYEKSADAVHLWRAWRVARIAGDIPPEIFSTLAPMIDKYTEDVIGEKSRADNRTVRYFILRDYYFLRGRMEHPHRPGAPKSEAEIYRKLASSFRTTSGAIKQLVLEHTGRGQRGRNRSQRNR